MFQLKKRDKLVTNKDTRWDRIRKRQQSGNLLALKTDAVRRLIERDYIGKHNEKMLINGHEHDNKLDPSIVMDMRHEMKIPRKLPLATVANQNNLKACIAHNLEVEERYIRNELNKFRQQLEKHHKRNELKTKPSKMSLSLDNTTLMDSLASTSKHIEDFYTAPVDALQEAVSIYTNELTNKDEQEKEVKEKEMPIENQQQLVVQETPIEEDESSETLNIKMACNENSVQRCRTPSPLTPTDEFFKPMRAAAERQMLHMRSVRLNEEEAKRKLHREVSSCSNTSDGIESVISDLADEVILELQMETEQEPKHVCFAEQLVSNINDVVVEQCQAIDEVRESTPVDLGPASLHSPITNSNPIQAIGKEIQEQSNEPLVITRLTPPKVVLTPKTSAESAQPTATNTSEEDDTTTETNEEQDRIIAQLFQARAHTNKTTLRKYFRMWIHYTTIERLERENCKARSDRVHKINAFLDNIRKEKKRIKQNENGYKDGSGENGKNPKSSEQREEAVKMAKQYKNKIKVQQDIIDLQRVKLERQERMIMELKLHKLTDEANEARQDLKQELKSFIRSGDPKSKAKAKCLQLIGNLRDAEDEEFARLQGKALLQPKFLQNMQERAIERSIRHEQARQRRLQAEAEREALKIAAEEAKRQEDEEAKRLRIEVLKEKRRQEKMAKVIKERERQRAIENLRKANEFCRRLLLRRVGIEGFKRLLQRKHDNLQKCVELRHKLYKRNFFVAWRDYTAIVMLHKQVKAKDCYHRAQKRFALFAWQMFIQNERSKMFVAIDWHSLRLVESVFSRWSKLTQKEKLVEEIKMRQAISHHEWHLQWKVLDCWQRLPQILQLEKETEERRQRWRMKIWELLPDYKPNREDHLW